MFEKFFDEIENLGKSMTGKANELGKKTGDMIEIQKLKAQIGAAKREITQNYEEIGELIYRSYQDGESVKDEVESLCKEIDELNAEIEAYKEEIRKYRKENVCPECGAPVPEYAAFCMQCGAAMPVKAQEEEAVEEEAPVEEAPVEEAPAEEAPAEEAPAEEAPAEEAPAEEAPAEEAPAEETEE